MKNTRNEQIFKRELVVLNYLINEYEHELRKTTMSYNGKEIKNTKKLRLHRLRLEINQVLKTIEDDLPDQFFKEVEDDE